VLYLRVLLPSLPEIGMLNLCQNADIGALSRMLIKTQDYLDVFARFKQKENIEAVERLLASQTELEMFERSQLGKQRIPSALILSVLIHRRHALL
jgi:hypothetical protein